MEQINSAFAQEPRRKPRTGRQIIADSKPVVGYQPENRYQAKMMGRPAQQIGAMNPGLGGNLPVRNVSMPGRQSNVQYDNTNTLNAVIAKHNEDLYRSKQLQDQQVQSLLLARR